MEVNKTTIVEKTVKSGVTFGSALAMVISYTTWKSIGWAIFHGLLSWVYVISDEHNSMDFDWNSNFMCRYCNIFWHKEEKVNLKL